MKFPSASLAALCAAVALVGCDDFNTAFSACVDAGRCVGDGGGPANPGLRFDDLSRVELPPTEVNRSSKTAIRTLINEAGRDVAYGLAGHDPLVVEFKGVDGGPACTETGIAAGTSCELTMWLKSAGELYFNGEIGVYVNDTQILQLSVVGDVVPRTSISLDHELPDGGYATLTDGGVDLTGVTSGVFRVRNTGNSTLSTVTVLPASGLVSVLDGMTGGYACVAVDAGDQCFFSVEPKDAGTVTLAVTPVVSASPTAYQGDSVPLTLHVY